MIPDGSETLPSRIRTAIIALTSSQWDESFRHESCKSAGSEVIHIFRCLSVGLASVRLKLHNAYSAASLLTEGNRCGTDEDECMTEITSTFIVSCISCLRLGVDSDHLYLLAFHIPVTRGAPCTLHKSSHRALRRIFQSNLMRSHASESCVHAMLPGMH